MCVCVCVCVCVSLRTEHLKVRKSGLYPFVPPGARTVPLIFINVSVRIISAVENNISSVQFICSVMPGSLRPHGLQHVRPPSPSPSLRVSSNSCPLSHWCHPTISSCCPHLLPPSIFLSIRVFSNESVIRIRWPKYWSFSFSVSPSNEYSGLISFRMDWLELLAVQGTLKSLLQHHSSKASILRHSAFL